MHPADIKAQLQKRGSPCIRIAERLRVPRSTVSAVVNGNGTSRRVAFEISRVIGRPVGEIWPGKYEPKVVRATTRRAIKRFSRAAGR